jgi:mannose-6-phosphate isomerase
VVAAGPPPSPEGGTPAEPASLADVVRADPVGAVGRPDGEALPFLAKVLAAAGPLSIQLHPDAAQAAAGYAREEAAGVPRTAPERTYVDDQPKPELVCALTPFSARCGLRPPEATLEVLEVLRTPALDPLRALLGGGGDALTRLRAALAWLLRTPAEDAARLVAEVAAAAGAVDDAGAAVAEVAWTRRLAQAYPGDVGVVVALLLHHVELLPGEALHLAAGQLHSYLAGVAVEVMAPSDNVVRGGLTSKHVDVDELLRLADVRPVAPAVQRPAGPDHVYAVPSAAFSLRRIDLSAGPAAGPVVGPALVLVLEGPVAVAGATGSLDVPRGRAAFVAAGDGPVAVRGGGLVCVAAAGAPAGGPAAAA